MAVYSGVAVAYEDRFSKRAERLTDDDHRRLLEFIGKLCANPESPGLSMERLRGRAADLWSARLSRDLRVTLRRDGLRFTLVDAGHHDAVYRGAGQMGGGRGPGSAGVPTPTISATTDGGRTQASPGTIAGEVHTRDGGAEAARPSLTDYGHPAPDAGRPVESAQPPPSDPVSALRDKQALLAAGLPPAWAETICAAPVMETVYAAYDQIAREVSPDAAEAHNVASLWQGGGGAHARAGAGDVLGGGHDHRSVQRCARRPEALLRDHRHR